MRARAYTYTHTYTHVHAQVKLHPEVSATFNVVIQKEKNLVVSGGARCRNWTRCLHLLCLHAPLCLQFVFVLECVRGRGLVLGDDLFGVPPLSGVVCF